MTGSTHRRVLLDACVPQWLRRELTEFDVETAQFAKLDQLPDTQLLDAIEGRFDAVITLDTSLQYQNNIPSRTFGIVVLRVEDQTPAAFLDLVPQIRHALGSVKPGNVMRVGKR